MLNGVTQLIMTKSDVLDGFDSIKIATAYKVNGEKTSHFPYEIEEEIEDVEYDELNDVEQDEVLRAKYEGQQKVESSLGQNVIGKNANMYS